jgi:hypothetical protein
VVVWETTEFSKGDRGLGCVSHILGFREGRIHTLSYLSILMR